MSEGTDNTTDKDPVYGFAPDRSRWRHYATDTDNTIYFYDRKSLVKQSNKARVWIKFGDPMNDENTRHFYKEATALKEIDCNIRLIRSIEWNFLSLKGEQKSYPSPTKWENIEPETSEDALLEEVCILSGKGKRR
jgi:hypothetical protein